MDSRQGHLWSKMHFPGQIFALVYAIVKTKKIFSSQSHGFLTDAMQHPEKQSSQIKKKQQCTNSLCWNKEKGSWQSQA